MLASLARLQGQGELLDPRRAPPFDQAGELRRLLRFAAAPGLGWCVRADRHGRRQTTPPDRPEGTSRPMVGHASSMASSPTHIRDAADSPGGSVPGHSWSWAHRRRAALPLPMFVWWFTSGPTCRVAQQAVFAAHTRHDIVTSNAPPLEGVRGSFRSDAGGYLRLLRRRVCQLETPGPCTRSHFFPSGHNQLPTGYTTVACQQS